MLDLQMVNLKLLNIMKKKLANALYANKFPNVQSVHFVII